MADSLILMVMALVVFGPRRLPQIGRQIGKLMYEFRKASNDFKFQMEEELRNSEEADRRKKEEERQRSLAALAATRTGIGFGRSAGTKSTPRRRYPAVTSLNPNPTRRIPRQQAAERGIRSTHHAAFHRRDSRRRASGRVAEPIIARLPRRVHSSDGTQPDTERRIPEPPPSQSTDPAEALNQHG